MASNFKLTHDDIKPVHENALDSFYSGIKSKEGKRTMDGNLKRFLVDVCADILEGNYKQRAQQFIEIARDDQDKTVQIILAYVRKLRQRTSLDKTDSDYLNPSTLPNKIKPIKKILDMNGLGIGWKRIYSSYPELDNTHKGRGYTREEIQQMLEFSDGLSTDFIILASSSGGLRVGAWDGLTWGDIFPIYEINGEYKIETEEKNVKIVCAGLTIYKNTPDEYITLISIEAWNKLQEYKKEWTAKMKRLPVKTDPLLLERFSVPKPITHIAVRNRIGKLVVRAGLRSPLVEGKRRHDVPATHGFRRFWDKVMMEQIRKGDMLSALVKKERLLGHEGIVKTDKNYYWTNILDMVPEYLQAMPELMINDEERLKRRLDSTEQENQRLIKTSKEKEQALERISELEAKVERMQKYYVKK